MGPLKYETTGVYLLFEDTSDPDFKWVRRYQNVSWERLMGLFWEPEYNDLQLEAAYQELVQSGACPDISLMRTYTEMPLNDDGSKTLWVDIKLSEEGGKHGPESV